MKFENHGPRPSEGIWMNGLWIRNTWATRNCVKQEKVGYLDFCDDPFTKILDSWGVNLLDLQTKIKVPEY